jgi:hypothetical protein
MEYYLNRHCGRSETKTRNLSKVPARFSGDSRFRENDGLAGARLRLALTRDFQPHRVIASQRRSNPENNRSTFLDCFAASRLAMTQCGFPP